MDLLNLACSAIDQHWFLLPVDQRSTAAGSTAYRERVYCYELYHQLRMLSKAPEGVAAGAPDYVLSGEIDKAGLNAVTLGGKEKPDLVWHVPGTSQNAVVVEVKPATRWSHRGVVKDLETLGKFLSEPTRAYRCGVLLVFGPIDEDVLRARVVRTANAVSADRTQLRNARLLWHSTSGAGFEDFGPIAYM